MPGSYADAQLQVWTPLFALPPLTACTGLSKANLCIVYGHFPRSQRETSTLRAICIKRMERGARQEQMFHVKHSVGSLDGRIAGWPDPWVALKWQVFSRLRGIASKSRPAKYRDLVFCAELGAAASKSGRTCGRNPAIAKKLATYGESPAPGGRGRRARDGCSVAARGAARDVARRAAASPTLRPARGPTGSRR